MVQPAAGTKIAIGTTASDPTADSFTVIADLATLPEFGKQFDDVPFENLGEAKYEHNTGAENAPSMSIGLGRDLTDAGQAAVQAANGVNSFYNFKVIYPDATFDYFKAKVQGFTTAPGGLTGNVMANIKVQPKPGAWVFAQAGSAPSNTVLPAISGIAQVGHTLTALEGVWANAPTSFTYAWQVDDGGGYDPISGATARTYIPVVGNVGYPHRVIVTAVNAAGSASATSGPTEDLLSA
jgi:hypothetical protein